MELMFMFNARSGRIVLGMHNQGNGSAQWAIDEAEAGMFQVTEVDLNGNETVVMVDNIHTHIPSRIMSMAYELTDSAIEQVGVVTRLLMTLY